MNKKKEISFLILQPICLEKNSIYEHKGRYQQLFL